MPTSTTGPTLHGARGWSYREVLPFFKRSEALRGRRERMARRAGELGVSDLRNDHPYCEAWLAAGAEAGHPRDRRLQRRAAPTASAATSSPCAAAGAAMRRPRSSRRCARGRTSTSSTGAQVTRVLVERGRARRRRVARRPVQPRERARRRRGDPRGRRAAVAAAAAALGHRPGGAAAAPRHRGRTSTRPRSARNLQDHYQARVIVKLKRADVAQRRRAQPARARADGRAVAVPRSAGR